MKACPFCGYDEGWVKESSYTKPIKYRVECKVCGAIGPESFSREMAEEKWNGILADIDNEKEFNKILNEEVMGGVSTPMATLNNTPGMGNAVPGSSSTNMMGSGDKWGSSINKKPYTQKPKTKKRKKIIKEPKISNIKENNLNPYDKLGTSIAKKLKVKMPFKKKPGKSKTSEVIQQKFEHKIVTFDEFLNEENKNKSK